MRAAALLLILELCSSESFESVVFEDDLGPTIIKSRKNANFMKINASYPGLRQLHVDPPMYLVDNFLTESECQQWQRDSEPYLQRSTVTIDAVADVTDNRTSSSSYMPKRAWLEHRFFELTSWPAAAYELPQITRYKEGQLYIPHYDTYDPRPPGPQREHYLHGGQRIATVLVYLNSVADGGATHFPDLGLRVRPLMGTALVFFPATVDGYIDGLAYHESEVTRATKWVMQVWMRQQAWASDGKTRLPRYHGKVARKWLND